MHLSYAQESCKIYGKMIPYVLYILYIVATIHVTNRYAFEWHICQMKWRDRILKRPCDGEVEPIFNGLSAIINKMVFLDVLAEQILKNVEKDIPQQIKKSKKW